MATHSRKNRSPFSPANLAAAVLANGLWSLVAPGLGTVLGGVLAAATGLSAAVLVVVGLGGALIMLPIITWAVRRHGRTPEPVGAQLAPARPRGVSEQDWLASRMTGRPVPQPTRLDPESLHAALDGVVDDLHHDVSDALARMIEAGARVLTAIPDSRFDEVAFVRYKGALDAAISWEQETYGELRNLNAAWAARFRVEPVVSEALRADSRSSPHHDGVEARKLVQRRLGRLDEISRGVDRRRG